MVSSCNIESHACCTIFNAFNYGRARIYLEIEFRNEAQLIRDQEPSIYHNMRPYKWIES